MGFGTINSGGAKPQDLSGYLKTELLGKAGGVAPLDEQAKIILDYLYTNAANALAKLDASGKLPTDLIPALSAYIAATAKGAANGVATLDANGKLPSGQLTSHSHAYSDITGKPSTFPPSAHSHAASEISGLATYLAGQGYGKVANGSYVGDGAGSTTKENKSNYTAWSNARSISLPFSPSLLLLFNPGFQKIAAIAQEQYMSDTLLGSHTASSGNVAYLNGAKLLVLGTCIYCSAINSANYTGYTYRWVAFA